MQTATPNSDPRPRQSLCLAFAAIAFLAVFWTLDEPGVAVDEAIYVRQGKALFRMLRHEPERLWNEKHFRETWDPIHEHPPLGRLILGFVHEFSDSFRGDPGFVEPRLARPAGAVAFAILIYAYMVFAWRIRGFWAAMATAYGIAFMPRLFGHAHFASLEMISVAACAVSITTIASAMRAVQLRRPFVFKILIAGLFLGIALLTKMTAILVVASVLVAAIYALRVRALLPLCFWLIIGFGVFIAGWPWLWPVNVEGMPTGLAGTWQRVCEYFASSVHRATLFVWYFGEQRSQGTNGVPWHYVWVISAVTIPVGSLIVATIAGLPACVRMLRTDVRCACIISLLSAIYVLFSLPLERYDGERLFLLAFPVWGILLGIGTDAILQRAANFGPFIQLTTFFSLIALFVTQSFGIVRIHPYELSYYNSLTSGLHGAEKLGLEPTYWGDSITSDLLMQLATVAPEQTFAYLFPTLHPDHATWINHPEMKRKRIIVRPGDLFEKEKGTWAIVFHRSGYLVDPLPQKIMNDGKVIAEVGRQGVWLARVYRLPQSEN